MEYIKKLCQTIYIIDMENKIQNISISCTDSIHHTVDIYSIWKLHRCYNSRDYYLQKEHVSMETDKWTDHMFHIMIQAKSMSLLHVMYNIYSEEAVYTKIMCAQYDYHM